MKKQGFTEEQIIAVLKEQEVGAKAADLCRKHGISEATFYNWKAKYGGMEAPSGARRGDAKLKKLLAEQMLDAAVLRELLAKNVWSASSVQGSATSYGGSRSNATIARSLHALILHSRQTLTEDLLRCLKPQALARGGVEALAQCTDLPIGHI